MKTRAPPKCKFFGCLLLHDRCWTATGVSSTIYRREISVLCAIRNPRLLITSSRRALIAERFGCDPCVLRVSQSLTLNAVGLGFVTWTTSRKRLPKDNRKAFDTFVLLVVWLIWKERNGRVVFDREASMPRVLAESILSEGRLWAAAVSLLRGLSSLGRLLGRKMSPHVIKF